MTRHRPSRPVAAAIKALRISLPTHDVRASAHASRNDSYIPVAGSDIAYSDVETTLGLAVSSAALPWADARKARRPGGWQLSIELIQAEAEQREGRLLVTLSVRATLRAREGKVYLAQTQASCRQAGLVDPGRGAPVIYSCMSRVGRDLAGWLGSVEPN